MRTMLQYGQRLISTTEVTLPNNDTLVIEVIGQEATDAFVVAQTFIAKDNANPPTTFCAWCGGVSIGCVTCREPTVSVNCVKREISCHEFVNPANQPPVSPT